jgi:hypothetical protein
MSRGFLKEIGKTRTDASSAQPLDGALDGLYTEHNNAAISGLTAVLIIKNQQMLYYILCLF